MHPQALVGYDRRITEEKNGVRVQGHIENYGCKRDFMLTNLAFLHRDHLIRYTNSPGHAPARAFVDKGMNGEDIAMNFVAANATGEAPIMVIENTHGFTRIMHK